MNSKARLEKLADELHGEFIELAKDACHPDNEVDAQIVGNNILHIINQFDECVKDLTILHLALILLYEIAEKRN